MHNSDALTFVFLIIDCFVLNQMIRKCRNFAALFDMHASPFLFLGRISAAFLWFLKQSIIMINYCLDYHLSAS